jgi:hypothetical protein
MPSTAISDIDYDESRETLTVTFITGRMYEYFDVPLDVAHAFQRASSKGAFFNRKIRDRYKFREIARIN